MDSLLFCDLAGEAKETVKEITKMKKDIESWKANVNVKKIGIFYMFAVKF